MLTKIEYHFEKWDELLEKFGPHFFIYSDIGQDPTKPAGNLNRSSGKGICWGYTKNFKLASEYRHEIIANLPEELTTIGIKGHRRNW